MPSPNNSPSDSGRPLRRLRLRLLSQLDQKYGREKSVLRKTLRSLERRLRREVEK